MKYTSHIDNPEVILTHESFVHGQETIKFRQARHQGVSALHFFQTVDFTTDRHLRDLRTMADLRKR